ncbi:MAG: hypothetical protein ABIS86_04850 [Streptosporangiaceae bacterium]
MTTPAEEAVMRAVRSLLGNAAEVSVEEFPSGAVSILLRQGGRMAVIDGLPSGAEWGFSVDSAEGAGFAGHDQIAASLDEALISVGALLSGPSD